MGNYSDPTAARAMGNINREFSRLEKRAKALRKLLKEGIREIKEKFAPQKIYIEAQTYAIGFYEREGFIQCSEEFLEDGIPHVKMELEL